VRAKILKVSHDPRLSFLCRWSSILTFSTLKLIANTRTV